MADFIGHVVSGLLTHANNSAVGICTTAVGEFVHRRAMVIAGILRYVAEKGGAMSASMMKVWADFWAGQASIVVSTSPPLSAEESKAVIRNIASDTSSNSSSSSTTTEGTASDNNSCNSSGAINSTANAQRAFFAGKRRRKAKRRTSSAKPSLQHLHEENSKDAAGTAAPLSASAQPAAPATSPVVPGTTTGAAHPSWQTFVDITTDCECVPGKKEDKAFSWFKVNRPGH